MSIVIVVWLSTKAALNLDCGHINLMIGTILRAFSEFGRPLGIHYLKANMSRRPWKYNRTDPLTVLKNPIEFISKPLDVIRYNNCVWFVTFLFVLFEFSSLVIKFQMLKQKLSSPNKLVSNLSFSHLSKVL